MTPNGDRDWLFGLFALQMGYVRRETLEAALGAWASNREKPLGQILVEQGAVEEGQRRIVEALLGSYPEPRTALETLKPSAADPFATQMPAYSVAPIYTTARYRIVRMHAAGGLGKVSVAEDAELHREVALKEIQEHSADNPDSRARFLLEAEITGGLEHPGIVPVYSLGYYPDGRPYYAMRFIRGDSLQQAIEHFHATKFPNPGERILALRKLLGRFNDVCQAIAYSHNRGIIHRDIKPSNVMLGKYGETLVVDWGLAKPLHRLSEVHGNGEESLRPSGAKASASLTQVGSAVGTPAYMSPEQAGGRLDLMGPQSDVYSLGATLYQLLTGQAPISGGNVLEVLERAQKGEVRSPRLIEKRIPAALEAIVLKAMAREPDGRYPTASALAEDIEHWLAYEPVTAYRESWLEKSSRWSRRHPGLVGGALAVLVTSLLGLGLLWAEIGHERRVAAERDVAEANMVLARNAVDECFSVATQEPLLQSEGMRRVRVLLMEKSLPFYENFQQRNRSDPQLQATLARNYMNVATINAEIGRKIQSLQMYEKALAVWKELSTGAPEQAEYAISWARTLSRTGELQHFTGQYEAAQDSFEQARGMESKLITANPDKPEYKLELARTETRLAQLLHDYGKMEKAREAYERSRALLEALVNHHPEVESYRSELASAHDSLAVLYSESGLLTSAFPSFERARAILEGLVAAHPGVADYQSRLAMVFNHLGTVERHTGHIDAARKAYGRASGYLEKITVSHPDMTEYTYELATTYTNIALVILKEAKPDREAALEWLHKALKIQESLILKHEEVPKYQLALGATCVWIGVGMRDSGQSPESLEWLTRGLRTLLAFRERMPGNPGVGNMLCQAYRGRSLAEGRMGRYREAIADWDEAMEFADTLTPEGMYELAESAAFAHGFAKKATDMDARERVQIVEKTARQALDVLSSAKAAGFFRETANQRRLKADTAFDPLRDRADFKSFVDGIGKP